MKKIISIMLITLLMGFSISNAAEKTFTEDFSGTVIRSGVADAPERVLPDVYIRSYNTDGPYYKDTIVGENTTTDLMYKNYMLLTPPEIHPLGPLGERTGVLYTGESNSIVQATDDDWRAWAGVKFDLEVPCKTLDLSYAYLNTRARTEEGRVWVIIQEVDYDNNVLWEVIKCIDGYKSYLPNPIAWRNVNYPAERFEYYIAGRTFNRVWLVEADLHLEKLGDKGGYFDNVSITVTSDEEFPEEETIIEVTDPKVTLINNTNPISATVYARGETMITHEYFYDKSITPVTLVIDGENYKAMYLTPFMETLPDGDYEASFSNSSTYGDAEYKEPTESLGFALYGLDKHWYSSYPPACFQIFLWDTVFDYIPRYKTDGPYDNQYVDRDFMFSDTIDAEFNTYAPEELMSQANSYATELLNDVANDSFTTEGLYEKFTIVTIGNNALVVRGNLIEAFVQEEEPSDEEPAAEEPAPAGETIISVLSDDIINIILEEGIEVTTELLEMLEDLEDACPFDNNWKNHGKYVSCVAKLKKQLKDEYPKSVLQDMIKIAAKLDIGK